HTHYEEASREIEEKVRNSAYEIIKRKHATYYGIAMSVKRICEAIIRDEKSVLPVSSLIDDVYSIRDVALSMPAIIGKDGVEDIMPIRLSYDEQKKLQNSAEVLREVIDEVL
ncbi:MAG: L-lactate dehydrogenase, partial [Synergistaceae bacterium]|nr:L-lactate dehydrogenase [Synergistaceae bacterium]